MRIVDVKHVEDCLDGSYIRELRFDEPVDEGLIRGLERFGTLQYFPDFARPFYRLAVAGVATLKGVQGNTTARATLFDEAALGWLDQLDAWLRQGAPRQPRATTT